MKTISKAVCAVAVIVSGLLAATGSARAQTAPALGAAQDVTVLGGTTITNTGATVINGNVALSPGSAITGFPPGTVTNGTINVDNALANQAHADAATAYTALAGETTTTNLSGTNLGTLTLTSGVYTFNSNAALTGTLTLNDTANPNAVFVFQIGTDLTTAANSAVVLTGSATDPNIFWQIGTSATLGSTSVFDGNILAATSISFGTGSSLAVGRSLAINGAVTFTGGTTNVNVGGPGAVIPLVLPGNYYWNGNGTATANWSDTNWSPTINGATTSTLPSGAAVVFSVSGVVVPKNESVTVLDVNETISSLTVNDSVPVTISNPIAGPQILTIFGASGATSTLTVNSGAGLVTIESNVQLSGLSQGIAVNNAAGLRIDGIVGGTLGLTKQGTGQLYLTNANTYTGGTAFGLVGDLTAGTVEIGTGATIPLNTPTNPTAITPFGAGTVTVNAPTTLTTDGAVTGNSYILANNFILAPPLTINVPTGTTVTMPGNFTGTEGLTINNPPLGNTGTLILSGNNTYGLGGTAPTEQTNVDAGTLKAGSNTAFSPNSDFILNNVSTLDLAGFSNSVGSLNGGVNAIVTSSAAVPNSPANLTILGTPNTPTVSTFSGNLNDGLGKLGLIKNDPNTLILNGGGTFSGGTTLNTGTLAVGSAGALGNGFLVNNATLETTASPIPTKVATAPLSINVASTYTQTAPATLLLQVVTSPPPTPSAYAGLAGINYDTLAVATTATLGGTLDLNFQSTSVPSQGQRYVAVSAGAPLTTTFIAPTTTNLATFNPGFYTVTTYNDNFGGTQPSNSVIVSLLLPFTSFPGLTPNQTSVAANIDRNVALLNNGGFFAFPSGVNKDFFDNIVTGLNISTYSGSLGSALDQLSPQRFEILRNVAFDNYALDTQSLDDELARERDGQGGLDSAGFALNDSTLGSQLSQIKSRLLAWSPAPEPGLLSDSAQATLGGVEMSDAKDMKAITQEVPLNRWNGFIDGGADLGDLGSNIDQSHASYTTGRVRGGVDFRVATDLRVGALFGYSHTDADLDNEGSKAHVDGYTPGLYAAYADKQGFYANGLFTYTRNDYSTDRDIIIPGVNRIATGSTSGNQFGGDLDGGYEFHKNNWTFGPSLGLTYVNLGLDSFNENGAGAADLNINSQSSDSLRSRLGGTVRYAGKIGSVVVTPHFSAFWQHEFLDDPSPIVSQFQGLPGGTFSVQTTRGDSDNALLGFGVDADLTKDVTLFVDYEAEAGGSSFFGQSASAGLKLGF